MKTQNLFVVAITITLGGFLLVYDVALISGTASHFNSLYNSFWLGFAISLVMKCTLVDALMIGTSIDKSRLKKSPILLPGLFAVPVFVSPSTCATDALVTPKAVATHKYDADKINCILVHSVQAE